MNERKVASCGELRNTALADMRSTCACTEAAFGWFRGIGAEVIASHSAAHHSARRPGLPRSSHLAPSYRPLAQNHRPIADFSPSRDQTGPAIHAFSRAAAAPPLMGARRLRMCGVWTLSD